VIDELDLLARARSLDEAALGAIFDSYYPVLYRYLYHHVHHRQIAEDLTAEVFTRLLEQLADGGGPERHLRAWLYRVAYNLVVDESRRRVHRDHDPLDEQLAVVEGEVEAHTEASVLRGHARAALMALTPQQRSVIVLKFLQGCENREIAQILDTTIGAVKALQHRGLAAMQQHLGTLQESGRDQDERETNGQSVARSV
jgi:RNA polymerase sigma-70 factor (ECF subfamily)